MRNDVIEEERKGTWNPNVIYLMIKNRNLKLLYSHHLVVGIISLLWLKKRWNSCKK